MQGVASSFDVEVRHSLLSFSDREKSLGPGGKVLALSPFYGELGLLLQKTLSGLLFQPSFSFLERLPNMKGVFIKLGTLLVRLRYQTSSMGVMHPKALSRPVPWPTYFCSAFGSSTAREIAPYWTKEASSYLYS
jgi:hypothetical protein